MKKIKHSKFKNTGFLFELLTRQITLEILNGSEEKAKKIIKEFYGNGTEMSKELRLFNLLINEKQEKDLRLLTYKILLETFNKKYTNLNDSQKGLLREYINNITNTSKFGDYFSKQLVSTITELHSLHKNMKDKITKIKLKETINVLKKQKIGKKINDTQVSALMMSYELIKEIKNVNTKKS